MFRFLIPLSLFEIFYFPDLKKKKDLVLGFSVFLFFLSFFLLFGEFGVGTRMVVVVVVKDDGFGLVSKDKRRRRFWCGTHHGVDIEARDSAFERTPVVVFFFKKGVARTKVRFVRVLVRVPTYDVCTIKHARCYFLLLLLLLLLLPNSRPRRLQR